MTGIGQGVGGNAKEGGFEGVTLLRDELAPCMSPDVKTPLGEVGEMVQQVREALGLVDEELNHNPEALVVEIAVEKNEGVEVGLVWRSGVGGAVGVALVARSTVCNLFLRSACVCIAWKVSVPSYGCHASSMCFGWLPNNRKPLAEASTECRRRRIKLCCVPYFWV